MRRGRRLRLPGLKVTGRGLGITPSDNLEMLRALGRDPLVIKETRILGAVSARLPPYVHPEPLALSRDPLDHLIGYRPLARMLLADWNSEFAEELLESFRSPAGDPYRVLIGVVHEGMNGAWR
jgi:hypothetical protein